MILIIINLFLARMILTDQGLTIIPAKIAGGCIPILCSCSLLKYRGNFNKIRVFTDI
jgi:hypothetical protein